MTEIKQNKLDKEIPVEDFNANEESITSEINVDGLSNRKFGEKTEIPNLDGQARIIADVKLIATSNIEKSKKNEKPFRAVQTKILFEDGNYTNLGGMRQYQYEDGNWGDPTFWIEGTNAMAKLFKAWLVKTKKDEKDVSMKDFLKGLIGMNVTLKFVEQNYGGNIFNKNIISSFV